MSEKDLNNLNEEDFDEIEDGDVDSDFDIKIKNSIGKHKIEGKHSLDRDTIFFGKIEEEVDETLESSFNLAAQLILSMTACAEVVQII